MSIHVIVVGKLKSAPVRALVDDYGQRLARYVRFQETEVKDDAKLAAAIPQDAHVVCLEVRGTVYDSEQFAQRLERWLSSGKGKVAFVIGGAEGIPPGISAAAGARISLSAMTLPHRLARVILMEQLYRGMTILKGEPYARELERER